MSQEKVNQKKHLKENRKSIVRKKKIEEFVSLAIVAVIGIAIVVWVGFSVYDKFQKSAEANAVNNNGLNRGDLYVADAFANPGPIIKRFIPRARGSANRINKRTSHVTVVLKERV